MWTGAILVLCPHPEDVLLFLDEFGHQVAASSQCGGDAAPADLQFRVVLLLKSVVEDLAATVVQRWIPLANHRVLPDFLKSEVHWRSRSICRETKWFFSEILSKTIQTLRIRSVQIIKPLHYIIHCCTEFHSCLCLDINYSIVCIHLNYTPCTDRWRMFHIETLKLNKRAAGVDPSYCDKFRE